MRRMTTLDNILPLKQKHLPKVFLIIPACNGAALTSFLALDYADLENIAINTPSGEHIISWIK